MEAKRTYVARFDTYHGRWCVFDPDEDQDWATFEGLNAEQLAREYAGWKNGVSSREANLAEAAGPADEKWNPLIGGSDADA